MPPPPPDRRDFLYRDSRRHDGGGGDGLAPAAPTPPRWRESPYHPPPPLRDHARPSPRRTPSSAPSEGYYRQGNGGYERPYPDEPHGYTPSRSDRYWLEDDGGGYKGFGRYGGGRRDGRDIRGSYRRSPFKSYGNDFSRSHQEQPPPPLRRSPLRSVAVPICYDVPGDRADRGDRDHHPRVMPWRPLRRRDSRSETMDAAGVGTLAVGLATAATPLEEAMVNSSVAAAPQVVEEEAPRKKARLGWGQGLAKYEKQKVQGSTESAPVGGVAEESLADAVQKAAVPASASVGCASPAAMPSPPAPCSSPVTEEKSCEQTVNTVVEPNKDVPVVEAQACNNEVPISLDQLGGDPFGSLANFLTELLQHEDACSGDSRRLTNMSKLSLLKESISKELEKTELEIDSLEGELKCLNMEAGNRACKDFPIAVTCAQNPSPCNATSKVPSSMEIYGPISPVKELGELIPSPKISVEQDAEVNGAEAMEIEMAPVDNAKTASSEESVACLSGAEAQISEAVNGCALFKSSEDIRPQIDAGHEMLEATLFHANVNSNKSDNSNFSTRPCSYDGISSNLIPSIMVANKDAVKEVSELVVKTLPADQPLFDLWALSHLSNHGKNDLRITQKLSICKNRLRFKEQLLTYKFKVLHHLWKEDVRLLSARKQRSKSNKRTDLNRASQTGSQRQRLSNRSRLTMPAGNLSVLPITEISDVASKLLSEFQIKRVRNDLKMPTLIIDEKEKMDARFISNNGLIEDPVSVEMERAMINPWTEEEKGIFMEMLATFGKDFSKISSFLEHKTTADCVEFYYKHHKSDSFGDVKKLLDLRGQQQPTSNYLGTKSGKKWNEANAASLDMLGVASVVAAHGLGYTKRVEKNSAKSILQTTCVSDTPYITKGSSDRDCASKVSLRERESVAADVLAGICGTLSPEAMGSCITSSADPGQKISFTRMEHPLTPEVDKSFDEEDNCSDLGCPVEPGDWNDDEKSAFLEALNNYGKDFARISSCVKSKSYEQCKVFFSKARKSLGLDLIPQGTGDIDMPMSDTNGGRSDIDEACAAEMDSVVCSTQSCSKLEMDVCPAADGTIQGHALSGVTSKQPETDRSNEQDVVEDVKVEESKSKTVEDRNILDEGNQYNESTHQGACGPIDINCSESTQKLQNMEDIGNMHDKGAVASSTEQAAATQMEAISNLHSVGLIQPNNVSEGVCVEGSKMKGCSHHVPESALMKTGNSAVSLCFAADGVAKENVMHFSDVAGVSSCRTAFYQHTTPPNLVPPKPKPQVTPLTPKDLMPVQFSSALPDPTSIRFEGIASMTTPNFEDHGNKVGHNLGAKDLSKCQIFKDPSVNQNDALFQNIDGYTQQRRNHHMATEIPKFSESTVGETQPAQFAAANLQNGRSSSSSLSNATSGMLWTRNGGGGPLKSCSHSASPESEERLKRPGDVKLFGQILSHQSLQSSGSSPNGSKSKPPSPKSDRSARRLLSTRDHMVCSSRPAIIGHLGLEERAVRSYAHLDGSTIQPGIQSLPEPVLMVAKCQRSLAGVPFYSAKNGSLGVLAEYQQPLMPQLSSDPKRLESFADLQKRKGIEIISGFQQPGKGSRLGGAGILVSSVADPVAALKVQYGPSTKILSNDVDPWKDIGGR